MSRCWIDIEHRKVVAPAPWRTRRQVFLVCLGYFDDDTDEFVIVNIEGDTEEDFFVELDAYLDSFSEIAFLGRRPFDQMALLGRMTHGRRAFLETPGPWPHLEDRWTWVQLKKSNKDRIKRVNDVNHADIPKLWNTNPVSVVHACMRDVAEAMLADPSVELSEEVRSDWERFVRNGT